MDKYEMLMDIISKNNDDDIVKYFEKNDPTGTIINGNNLLHLLAVSAPDYLPKILKINKFTNYFKFGDKSEGNTPIHLLAKYGQFDLLKECLTIDNNLGNLVNQNNENILFMAYDNKDIFKWILNNCNYDINCITTYGLTILTKAIMDKDNKLIEELVALEGINLSIPKSSIPLIGTIILKNVEGTKILLENGSTPNIIDNNNKTPLIYSVLTKNKEICKLLIKHKADLNFVGIDREYNPLTIALVKHEPEICDILLNNNINVNTTDKYMETPVHIALKLAKYDRIEENILTKIVEKGDLNMPNINGITPYQLIIKNNLLKKMNKVIKNKISSNTHHANKQDINMLKVNKINNNYGLFNPDLISNILFIIGILEKYDNVAIPYQCNILDKKRYDMNICDITFQMADNNAKILYELNYIYTEFFYQFVPYVIIWKNRNEYIFPKNLKIHCKNILKDKKKRFIIFKLTLIPNQNGTHANLIIYDKQKQCVERFEPFGYNSLLDADILDKKIEKYFTKVFGKIEYMSPKSYQNKIKFQIISDDSNPINKKSGDPFGYCLAWTYWYLELRLLNPDKNSDELINDAYDKIVQTHDKNKKDNFMLNFIRDYAITLDKMKNDILNKIGIEKMQHYNVYSNLLDAVDLINKITDYYKNNIIDSMA